MCPVGKQRVMKRILRRAVDEAGRVSVATCSDAQSLVQDHISKCYFIDLKPYLVFEKPYLLFYLQNMFYEILPFTYRMCFFHNVMCFFEKPYLVFKKHISFETQKHIW